MKSAQQLALEALAGRALAADEMTEIGTLLVTRNDVAIAAVLSTGRTVLITRTIDERGVRAQLPVVQADALLSLLGEVAAAETIPEWLSTMLKMMNIPAVDQSAYFRTFACARPWLQQEAGIDLGASTTRAMLDLIAQSDPPRFSESVATLKALAERPDPIQFEAVSRVLNVAEGRMTS